MRSRNPNLKSKELYLWRKKYGGGIALCDQCGKKFLKGVYDYDRRFCSRKCAADFGRPLIPKKHGLANKCPEYYVWKTMHQRCINPKSTAYKNYGARGIKVCRKWSQFDEFLNDMGNRPGAKYSIHRKDNNGDYTPNNCRWATVTEQARLKRSNRLITLNGKQLPVAVWAEALNVHPDRIHCRLSRGWTAKRALTTPFPTKINERRS